MAFCNFAIVTFGITRTCGGDPATKKATLATIEVLPAHAGVIP